jgi:hypothetical protein
MVVVLAGFAGLVLATAVCLALAIVSPDGVTLKQAALAYGCIPSLTAILFAVVLSWRSHHAGVEQPVMSKPARQGAGLGG